MNNIMDKVDDRVIIEKLRNGDLILNDHVPKHLEYKMRCEGYAVFTILGVNYVCPIFNKLDHQTLYHLYLDDDRELRMVRISIATYNREEGIKSLFTLKEVVWFDQAA